MKLFIVLLFPLMTLAQKKCAGVIVDKATGNKISYASVGLIKENKGVSANEQGAFIIYSTFPLEDSVCISAVGYQTQKISVAGWVDGRIVQLIQKAGLLKEIVISSKPRKVYTLNHFGHCSWNTYWISTQRTSQLALDLETQTRVMLPFYQLAQRFEAPEQNMQLINLELCKDKAESIFRFRIYDVDSLTGGPSKDLADTIIEVHSGDKHVQVNLEQFHIFIPGKRFFVAIEWLFIPLNEQHEEKIQGRKRYYTLYKPALRWVTTKTSNKGNVWQLHFNGRWSEIYEFNQNDNFQITVDLR